MSTGFRNVLTCDNISSRCLFKRSTHFSFIYNSKYNICRQDEEKKRKMITVVGRSSTTALEYFKLLKVNTISQKIFFPYKNKRTVNLFFSSLRVDIFVKNKKNSH